MRNLIDYYACSVDFAVAEPLSAVEEIKNDAITLARSLALTTLTAYAKDNPLGGPAAKFRAIAERIEAGEDYAAVLADYGIVETGPLAGVPRTQSEKAIDECLPSDPSADVPPSHYRPATLVECLATIKVRLSDVLSPAEQFELQEAIGRIRQLERELAEATEWNHRVSVCAKHTAEIVDGECLVCALEYLQAELDIRPTHKEQQEALVQLSDAKATTETLHVATVPLSEVQSVYDMVGSKIRALEPELKSHKHTTPMGLWCENSHARYTVWLMVHDALRKIIHRLSPDADSTQKTTP